MRKFLKRRAIGFIILVIVIGIIAVFYFSNTQKENDHLLKSQNGEPVGFVWKFEYAATTNLDGNPQTNVYLEIDYTNGEIQNKLIATTDGGCNELPDSDLDNALNSKNIQCYYAGFGERFKITKGETSYLVKRQTFEEGTPDHNPPTKDYEVLMEIPF